MKAVLLTQHPIYQWIRDAQIGPPPEDQLIKLPGTAAADIRRAVVEVLNKHAAGDARGAQELAADSAVEIINALPAVMQDPGFFSPLDPLADVTDPRALAAVVRQW